VTMLDSMRRQADKTNVFFHGFPNTRLGTGHWNENGHRAAGGILARALCDAL
jgi:hypothetical protein